MIKNKNYNYQSINNDKIYIYYDIKEFNKLFYKDNYEDYYALSLTEYFIDNDNLFD